MQQAGGGMKISGRHPGAVLRLLRRTGEFRCSEGSWYAPSAGPVGRCPDPTTAHSPQPGLLSAWRALLGEPGRRAILRFSAVSPTPVDASGRHALSRIAQLDQRTALPDQCLHSAEADVRPPRRKSGFDPERLFRHGAKPKFCIRLSLVVTLSRGERNAATWSKRAAGQGSAR